MSTKTIFRLALLGVLLTLGGCAKHMGVGYNETYCEEHGCDYSDAGVCGDPMKIYKYRKYIDESSIAYKNLEE